MKKNKIHFWFTLIEIIVVISILTLLATISFISYKEYLTQSRDTNRVTSLSTISKWLKQYFFKNSKYPNPNGTVGIGSINGVELWKTGFIGEEITQAISMKNKPTDPFSWNEFSYWVPYNNKSFQLAATTEGLLSSQLLVPTTYAQGLNKAYVVWNYQWILKRNWILYNIPSMIYTGAEVWWKIELTDSWTYFVVNKSTNTPYDISDSNEKTYQSTSEILINVLWSSTGTINSYDIKSFDWDTGSWELSEILGYNTDTLWLYLYGEDFTPTLWVPPIKSTWSTNPGTPPPLWSSWVVLFSLDFETEWWYNTSIWSFTRWVDWTGTTNVLTSWNHGNNSSSCFDFTVTTTEQSEINFDYFVSSENNYDYFEFYVNGAIKKKLAWDFWWQKFNNSNRPFPPDTYRFEFCYSKDGSVNSYDDKIMVDNIVIKTNNYTPPVFNTFSCQDMTQENVDNLNIFFDDLWEIMTEWVTFEEQKNDYCNLSELWLWRYDIIELPIEIWYLTNLSILDIQGNNITELPNSIGNLINITELNISDTAIVTLPSWIENFSLLTSFYAYWTQLSSLPPSISWWTNIAQISISSPWLTSLPTELFSLSTLNDLYLDWNALTTFDIQPGQLPNLTGLSLSRNLFEEIPEWISNLSNLSYFSFAGNTFTTFPDLTNLVNLIELDLSECMLTEIPDGVLNLSQINDLYLRGNEISVLPTNIGNLVNLYSLDLANNQLASLPAEIWNLENVGYMRLWWNQLTTLPDEILNLVNLYEIDISNNLLTTLPESITNMVNLNYLWVGYNELTTLPENIWNLVNLNSIDLVSNNISVLPASFANLSGISWLNLLGNNFTTFPTLLWNLPNLTSIDLSYNNMTTIPADVTNLNNKLNSLNLLNNPGLWNLNYGFNSWNTTVRSNLFPWVGTITMKWNNAAPYKIVITYTP